LACLQEYEPIVPTPPLRCCWSSRRSPYQAAKRTSRCTVATAHYVACTRSGDLLSCHAAHHHLAEAGNHAKALSCPPHPAATLEAMHAARRRAQMCFRYSVVRLRLLCISKRGPRSCRTGSQHQDLPWSIFAPILAPCTYLSPTTAPASPTPEATLMPVAMLYRGLVLSFC
jgi:hypothetical protein